jgi:hypothetical protein
LSLQDTVVIVVVCHSNHFTQQQKHRIAKYTLLINNHYYIHQSNYIATLSFYHDGSGKGSIMILSFLSVHSDLFLAVQLLLIILIRLDSKVISCPVDSAFLSANALIPQIPLFCLVPFFGNICNLENQQLICEDRHKYGHSLLPAEVASFLAFFNSRLLFLDFLLKVSMIYFSHICIVYSNAADHFTGNASSFTGERFVGCCLFLWQIFYRSGRIICQCVVHCQWITHTHVDFAQKAPPLMPVTFACRLTFLWALMIVIHSPCIGYTFLASVMVRLSMMIHLSTGRLPTGRLPTICLSYFHHLSRRGSTRRDYHLFGILDSDDALNKAAAGATQNVFTPHIPRAI